MGVRHVASAGIFELAFNCQSVHWSMPAEHTMTHILVHVEEVCAAWNFIKTNLKGLYGAVTRCMARNEGEFSITLQWFVLMRACSLLKYCWVLSHFYLTS